MKQTQQGEYRDLGITAQADEPRTSVLFKGADGNFYFAICSRGFLVLIDLNTKKAEQFIYPEKYLAYPFGSIASRSGKIYLGAGTMFMEFDPVKREFTYFTHIHPETVSYGAWSPAEAPDGTIFFGAYPKTYLTAFDPASRTLTDYGVMDETQEYLGTIAVDDSGFVYCSIGLQTQKIIAFNPSTGVKNVISLGEGVPGGAAVCRARDNRVYATFEAGLTHSERNPNYSYFILENGEKCGGLTDPTVAFNTYGSGFQAIHCIDESCPTILYHDLPEHRMVYLHPKTGEETEITFDYKTEGADMSPLICGPDGKIYGTTNHPIQFYSYDDQIDEITVHGKLPLSKERLTEWWGNICAYAIQGDIIGGCAYCGGFITRIDTAKPFGINNGEINPSHEGTHDEIYRPRCALAYPDGKTMLFGGFTLNGQTGGGLVIYDIMTRKTQPVKNSRLALHHSVMSMTALPTGEVLCGTTIAAPFGGYIYENEGILFGFDINTLEVLYQVHPIEGASEISHMKLDRLGIVHAITAEGICFAYDPVTRSVIKTTDLSKYGEVVRDGLQTADDGMIYGLLSNAIYRIDPGTLTVEVISQPPQPITAGMAVKGNKIYFGGDTHLWSYSIPGRS